MPKKKPQNGKPQVHKDLEGFEIKINEFGQIVANYDVDKMNDFLNKNVDDKKLRDRDDLLPTDEETDENLDLNLEDETIDKEINAIDDELDVEDK